MTDRKIRKFSATLISLYLVFSLLISPVVWAGENQGTGHLRLSFSAAVENSLRHSAAALDQAMVKLCKSLDQSDNIDVKIDSHFYDNDIRRYLLAVSGRVNFSGKFPFKPDKTAYLITCNQEISYDISITRVQTSANGSISCNFAATFVFSMDRLAYKMMETIPHLAASGAMEPAFDLLAEFCTTLTIGILSQAISETCRNFSDVALTKAGAELINQAGKNKHLGLLIRDSIRNGSIIDYLGITILKTAATTMVSVSGATLGSMVGSAIAPGPGTAIGAFFGSQILSLIAKAVIHELSAEIPVKINLKRMITSWRILNQDAGNEKARLALNEAQGKIKKKILSEFGNEKFSLFKTLLEEIDQMYPADRQATVPLLKELQETLMFKVTMDGDWYFARQYHQLRLSTEKWGMQKQIIFTSESNRQNSGR